MDSPPTTVSSIPEENSGIPTAPTNLTMARSVFVRSSDGISRKKFKANSDSDLNPLPDKAVNEILVRMYDSDIPPNTDSSIPEENLGILIAPTELKMVHSILRCSDGNTRKKLKANSDSDLDPLPDKAVNEILVRMSAQDILNAAMFVSRKWYQMTHTHKFAFDHLRHSPPGLFVQDLNSYKGNFMWITPSGQIEMSKLSYKFRTRVWSSCNGLVLELKPKDTYELIITNPLTNQHFTPPPFFIRTLYPHSKSTMVYVDSQMEYKLVRTYYLEYPTPEIPAHCAILTVGVDKSWRCVDTQHLSLEASHLLNLCPLVTEGGFVHYAEDWHSNDVMLETNIITQMSNQFVLTLNTETEKITHISAPQSNGGYYYYKYLSGGNRLSLMIGRGFLKWEVWEMKPETGEWTKLPDIDLGAHKALLNESYVVGIGRTKLKPSDGDWFDCKLLPAGWLKYREVIVFVTYGPYERGSYTQSWLRVFYNVQTQDVSLLVQEHHCHPYTDHRNSLIELD